VPFYNSFGGLFYFFVSIEGNLKVLLFNSSSPLLWQLAKVKIAGCFSSVLLPFFLQHAGS
jgi:hypothetical protein